uniref:VENT homeobox n=1 Tax=Pelodiscus sinensis TaxID=13735 RepID=K7F7L5_PELSI
MLVYTHNIFLGTPFIKEGKNPPPPLACAGREAARMTKAPFSVEWLSQSSQATSERPQRAEGARGSSRGFFSPLGNPACSSSPAPQPLQPAGRASQRGQRGEAIKSLDNGPKGETLLDPSSVRAAPAAAQRAWSAAESGSEWESGRSECQSPEAPSGKGSRRLRTAFSVEQISTLESSFKRHKYLGSAERRKLAAKMQLSEVQIKTWFQNRRMKLKWQLQEMRLEPFYSPVPLGARPRAPAPALPLPAAPGSPPGAGGGPCQLHLPSTARQRLQEGARRLLAGALLCGLHKPQDFPAAHLNPRG